MATPKAKPEPALAGAPPEELRLGVSACILGQEVRFNGGHKLDRFIRDTLGSYVTFVPLCPEVEIGLGTPRETIRLEQALSSGREGQSTPAEPTLRLVAPRSGADHTDRMTRYAAAKCRELASADLCGFIVQKGSPSCGMERVKVYGASGQAPTRSGRGMFTAALMAHFPHLPVEEDGRLNDPRLRDNFIERLFAYRRLRAFFGSRWRLGGLVAFHTREKLLVMAHDRPAYQTLGRLVASAKGVPRAEVEGAYTAAFLTGLKKIATTRKHTNVLLHAAGHLKRVIDAQDRQELHGVIESYHKGLVPLVVPMTLLRHHVRRHSIDYLAEQTYLDPHPQELMLRNHV